MFSNYETSEILGFMNSLIRMNEVENFQHLYNCAKQEIETRSPLLATLYDYREFIDSESD